MAKRFWKYQYPPDRDDELPESRGVRRFFEILGVRFAPLFLSGFAAVVALMPGAVGFFAFRDSVPIFAMLSAAFAGLLASPFYEAMCRLIWLSLSGEPGYFGERYKKYLKGNWKRTLLPGAAFGFVLGVIVTAIRMFFSGDGGFFLFCTAVIIDFALYLSVLTAYTMDKAAYGRESGRKTLISVLKLLGENIGWTLLSIAMQGAYWLIIYLFFPYTAYVLVLLGVWFPALLGAFPLYKTFAGMASDRALPDTGKNNK